MTTATTVQYAPTMIDCDNCALVTAIGKARAERDSARAMVHNLRVFLTDEYPGWDEITPTGRYLGECSHALGLSDT